MLTAKLEGGLGNMMFQVAATYAVALENGDECAFAPHTSPNQGMPSNSYINNIFRKVAFFPKGAFTPATSYVEPVFHFKKIPYAKNTQLKGYFQSEKYFTQYAKEIRSLFEPSDNIRQYIKEKYPIVNQKTISMHVRRGDYLKFPDMHPVCEKKYYYDAIENLVSNHGDYNILICSDDVAWCKQEFSNMQIIEGEQDWIDLYLMSMCTHNIIANSSFSWWSAWLNNNINKTVIAPKIFVGEGYGKINTNDVYPNEWKRM